MGFAEFDRSSCLQCGSSRSCRFLGLNFEEIEEIQRKGSHEIFDCVYIDYKLSSEPGKAENSQVPVTNEIATPGIRSKVGVDLRTGHLDLEQFLKYSFLPPEYFKPFCEAMRLRIEFINSTTKEEKAKFTLLEDKLKEQVFQNADERTRQLFNILEARAIELFNQGNDGAWTNSNH